MAVASISTSAFAMEKITLPLLPPVKAVNNNTLPDYAGKPILVVFWAVWCAPCMAELKDVEKFYQEKEIAVVGISVESPQKKAENFLKRVGITFDNFLDENSAFADNVQITGVPTLLILDKHGNTIWMKSGYSTFPEKELRGAIQKIKLIKKE
ncbi:MAG TPA: TlpA disulfide reductase family protein [Turneriella sp.]|nr:TlpA disulfide reductase family protein [Turneriella sp.]